MEEAEVMVVSVLVLRSKSVKGYDLCLWVSVF